jgi:hypothetical protein
VELERDTHTAYDSLHDQIHGSISIGLKPKQSVVGGPPEKFYRIVANALRETKRDLRRLETMMEDQAAELVDAIEAEITESFLSTKWPVRRQISAVPLHDLHPLAGGPWPAATPSIAGAGIHRSGALSGLRVLRDGVWPLSGRSCLRGSCWTQSKGGRKSPVGPHLPALGISRNCTRWRRTEQEAECLFRVLAV